MVNFFEKLFLNEDKIKEQTAKDMLDLFELTVRNTSDVNWKSSLLKQIKQWNKDLT